MDRRLTLPIQELIRAFEGVSRFASDHKGLPEEDCEAVLFYARELIREMEAHCEERHHDHDSLKRESLKKRVA